MYLQRSAGRLRQRGVSFLGLVFVAVLAVALVLLGVESVPMFVEYVNAKRAITQASRESTVADVLATFDRAAALYGVQSLKSGNLDVTKRGAVVVVSFRYERQIHLLGPMYLMYRFEAQTD